MIQFRQRAAKLVQRVVGAFETSANRLLPQLEAAHAAGEWDGVRHVAHTLKSSSASVGAFALSKLCAEVESLIRDGRSDGEIREYLVQRYGEFVLYRPRVGAATWLLWFGPAVLLIGGAFVVAGLVRRRAPRNDAPDDTDQEW